MLTATSSNTFVTSFLILLSLMKAILAQVGRGRYCPA
jgi:hypothetical protein